MSVRRFSRVLATVFLVILPLGYLAPASATTDVSPPEGYWIAAADGGVFSFGSDTRFFGSLADVKLQAPIVGIAATPTGNGYWLAAADGGVFAFGDAPFLGSLANTLLNRPVVGIAATPTGKGYWLAASDGGVFAFGDAPFLGVGGDRCEQACTSFIPVVGVASSPSGYGYWLVSSTGEVWALGSAKGTKPGCADGECATAIAAGPAGGYVVSDASGRFSWEDPAPKCQKDPPTLRVPYIIGVAVTAANSGCWLLGNDGGVFTTSSVPFLGSLGGVKLNAPPVSIAALPRAPA